MAERVLVELQRDRRAALARGVGVVAVLPWVRVDRGIAVDRLRLAEPF